MSTKITKIGITNEKISARGGIFLFLKFIEQTKLYDLIFNSLSEHYNYSGKGLKLRDFLKQMFAFFIDGTDMSMSGFDNRKQDECYAAILESNTNQLASSHQIKRFFSKLSVIRDKTFNKILHQLFIWRLNVEKPKIIELGIDTMVLDNDSAHQREGCEPTYKRKKGFQPLHICWGPFLIDVMFRKGSAHSNHGTDYIDRVTSIVELIRKKYSSDVPIILYADSGFCDQKAFKVFEDKLKIHYTVTGKFYEDTKKFLRQVTMDEKDVIRKGKTTWKFTAFGNKLKSWDRFRPCIFTSLQSDDKGQTIMDFARPDNIIYHNFGNCPEADKKLKEADGESYFETKTIITKSHQRGADELIHRSIKELATKENLPFQSLGMNRVYYFLLVITHFMFEVYKQDVARTVISEKSYPNTFRRKLIDFAVKITSHSRNITLKVTKSIYHLINIEKLWKLCQSPPRVILC